MMSEDIPTIQQGEIKIYTHEEFFVVNKAGKLLKIRMSFDEQRIFIRSAHILTPDISFEGDPIYKAKSIKTIILSDKAYEKAAELNTF